MATYLLLHHVCDNGGICGDRGVCMCGDENRERVFVGEERMLVGEWKWDRRRGLYVSM